jgi:hypothetical protein
MPANIRRHFHPSLIFVGKTRANQVWPLMGFHYKDRVLALSANIRTYLDPSIIFAIKAGAIPVWPLIGLYYKGRILNLTQSY